MLRAPLLLGLLLFAPRPATGGRHRTHPEPQSSGPSLTLWNQDPQGQRERELAWEAELVRNWESRRKERPLGRQQQESAQEARPLKERRRRPRKGSEKGVLGAGAGPPLPAPGTSGIEDCAATAQVALLSVVESHGTAPDVPFPPNPYPYPPFAQGCVS